ncbi:MAG: LysE family transporter [Methanomassiliicoccales archaeon]
MSIPDSPAIFLAMVGLISLSGVVMPGPVFAATVANGYKDMRAGLKIAAGHALVEIPLIAAIFLGFDALFKNELIFAAIGLMGGALLGYMGYSMIRAREEIVETEELRHGSFTAGVLTTAANPYFFLWWATIGATLVAGAVGFGLFMLPLFALVHTACDFGWEGLLSFSVFKTKGLWSRERHHLLFLITGAIMLLFAVYFVSSSTLTLLP